ncbi:hypothetical protein A5646_20500 [Mycobacterium sp. 1245499.0]|nr:hypothetical protein A5646_20500 [Mycobacterium sp. 1245499.0]
MPTVKFYQRPDGRQAIWVVHNGEYTFYVDCARCGKPLPPQVRKENPYRRRRGLGDEQRWKDLHPECRVSDDEAHFRDMKAKKARYRATEELRKQLGGITDYAMRKYEKLEQAERDYDNGGYVGDGDYDL